MMDHWGLLGWQLPGDFAPLTDPEGVLRIVMRLALAATLGGLLGYEREKVGKSAGLRTHMLVAMGAAFFALAPSEANMASADISRIIQGIITGIGFLGAGAILKHSSEGDVKGLTTAAGIWLTAAIGIAVGIGQMASALIGTVLALIVLALFPRLSHWIGTDDGKGEKDS